MKVLLFDSGPIISLALNNLLWVLYDLQKKFDGAFCITKDVKREIVDTPLKTKRYKLEAIQVMRLIHDGVLTIEDHPRLSSLTDEMLRLANSIFEAHGNYIRILHRAEMSVLALSHVHGYTTVVVDEKSTRLLIENPHRLHKNLERTLHTKVDVNKHNLEKFTSYVSFVHIIRSVELVTIAHEHNLFGDYIEALGDLSLGKRTLLESLVWGVKLSGCAVSEREIRRLIKIEAGKDKRKK